MAGLSTRGTAVTVTPILRAAHSSEVWEVKYLESHWPTIVGYFQYFWATLEYSGAFFRATWLPGTPHECYSLEGLELPEIVAGILRVRLGGLCAGPFLGAVLVRPTASVTLG